MRKTLQVGDVARSTGKSVRAVHLYEQLGLIEPIGRTKGRYRLFDEGTIDRISWISSLQEMGLSLTEIQRLIERIDGLEAGREAHGHMRSMYEEKLVRLRKVIAGLGVLEKELLRSLTYLEVCKECEPAKPKEACIECQRDHGLDKPALVRGLHADRGWKSMRAQDTDESQPLRPDGATE